MGTVFRREDIGLKKDILEAGLGLFAEEFGLLEKRRVVITATI